MSVSTEESWRTRKTNLHKGINELKKQFVKSELMNYHYFKACWEELEKRRIELTETYLDRLESTGGGSVIKLPYGSSCKSPWQHEKTAEIADLLERMSVYEQRLDMIDAWLGCLSDTQKESILEYVVNCQCANLDNVADILNISVGRIRKACERSYDKIINKFL